ncbi:MAG: nickel/cobalt transporter [Alphaproteobacteria bacterium]
MLAFQREANAEIAVRMRAIRDHSSPAAFWVALGLAFLYGVLHAAGPGHGKAVVVSYFLAREARVGRGLRMGALIAFFHVISAIVIVSLADLLLRHSFGGMPGEIPAVRIASYGSILLIGLIMLVQAIRRAFGQAGHDHHHHHDHGSAHGHGAHQGLLAFGVGLIPCTGAVLAMLYALANDIVLAGAAMVAAIGVGMAATMAGLGLLAVVARRFVTTLFARHGEGRGRLAVAIEIGGALAITLSGGLLFAASL